MKKEPTTWPIKTHLASLRLPPLGFLFFLENIVTISLCFLCSLAFQSLFLLLAYLVFETVKVFFFFHCSVAWIVLHFTSSTILGHALGKLFASWVLFMKGFSFWGSLKNHMKCIVFLSLVSFHEEMKRALWYNACLLC